MGFLDRFRKNSPVRDLSNLTNMLKQATLADRGTFVAYAAWIRAGLEVEDNLPQDTELAANGPAPTIYDAWMQFRLDKDQKVTEDKKTKRILAKDLNPLFHNPRETIICMNQFIKLFIKEKQPEKAAVLNLWCLSLRGLLRNEYKPLVEKLWGILMPSKSYWYNALDKIAKEDEGAGMPPDLLKEVYAHARAILNHLPPTKADNTWPVWGVHDASL